MGIRRAIPRGGLFPEDTLEADLEPDMVFQHAASGNHPSFVHSVAAAKSGYDMVKEYVDSGFGMVFSGAAAASTFLGGSPVAPAPLGCIVTEKPDGTEKTRVIMDLRRNMVNAASVVPEGKYYLLFFIMR